MAPSSDINNTRNSAACEGSRSHSSRIPILNYQSLLAFVFAISEINRNPHLLPNITLGFHIADPCSDEERAVTGMIDILAGRESPVPNFHCGSLQKLVGVVDGISSKVTLLLAKMFGMYKIPQLNHFLKNLQFTTPNGEKLHFDENGDMYSKLDIMNWIVNPNDTLEGIRVGSFKHQGSSSSLIINESLIRWPTAFNQTPGSYCSETCTPGYRRAQRKGFPACCYDCISCPQGEISNRTDAEICFSCPDTEWANENQTKCTYKAIIYLSYGDALGISLTLLSGLFSLLTCSVMMIFIKHRNTPIVKANNRDLSYILLLSIKMCFLCILLFIGHPDHVTCILRQTVFAITFTICLSSILAKTVTVIIAFNATKPGSRIRNWMGSRVSISILVFCFLIQVTICAGWLGISPPFPYYNIEDEVGVIVVQCNEGSTFGFYSALGFLGLLALVSFIVAFFARNLPDVFNEAKFITFSMLVFCSVWISFIPAYLSTKGKYVVAVEIFAILASSLALLGCIFIPKCFIILVQPECNTVAFVKK
ncbi:hypothetical protein GDO86_016219 [Hymenochirus boettgeri]|uniref:G-protein coupled receptors family 3 profile domain-containing protein n=1 Tax=Hymenochirus boettgeri TaxID=247094 RepID=A0A8T2K0F3_9PIPI|nr:hypothetical protein GDO86_016219 [Hymenochirus boettgeri]